MTKGKIIQAIADLRLAEQEILACNTCLNVANERQKRCKSGQIDLENYEPLKRIRKSISALQSLVDAVPERPNPKSVVDEITSYEYFEGLKQYRKECTQLLTDAVKGE